MKFTEAIEPITALKSHSAELIRRARETGQPIIITQNGRARGVLLDIEAYQRQRDALAMLKLMSQGSTDCTTGLEVSHDEAKKRLSRTLDRLRCTDDER